MTKEEAEKYIKAKFGTTEYKGKVPGEAQALVPVYRSSAIAVSGLTLLEAKKRMLSIAVKEERFEDAAKIRDEIKELEKRRLSDEYGER